jgi:hypothetical protein
LTQTAEIFDLAEYGDTILMAQCAVGVFPLIRIDPTHLLAFTNEIVRLNEVINEKVGRSTIPNPITFMGCDGEHRIKREHLDEEGETTLFDAEPFDMWRAGYADIKQVEAFVTRMELSPCACDTDEHDKVCAVAIATELSEHLHTAPDELPGGTDGPT